jgi:hypothetical protein
MTNLTDEQLAAKHLYTVLHGLSPRVRGGDVRVRVVEDVPEVSDTIFGYRHVQITLGPTALPFMVPLREGLKEHLDAAITHLPARNGLKFHGPLEALSQLNEFQLLKTMQRDAVPQIGYMR